MVVKDSGVVFRIRQKKRTPKQIPSIGELRPGLCHVNPKYLKKLTRPRALIVNFSIPNQAQIDFGRSDSATSGRGTGR